MNTFPLTVVTSQSICFQGRARTCTIVGITGSRTFEAHHEAFVTVLKSPSVLGIRAEDGREVTIQVKDGLISFARNSCTVVVGSDASP